MDDEQIIPRKPLPSSNGRSRESLDRTPVGSTIRMVPARDSVLDYTRKDNDDVDALAPELSKIDLGGSFRTSVDSTGMITPPQSPTYHKIPRKSLEKPLPKAPSSDDRDVRQSKPRGHDATRALEKKLGVNGVVDLGHSEDTTVHERMAPAVVHETIRHDVHEIRHEQRTRDIHEYHHHHRMLPIIDIEVKPAKHFIQNSFGKRTEISAEQVPGRDSELTQRVLEEVYKDMLPKNKSPPGSRQFSARTFSGSQGDDWESETPEGVKLSEKWWVHAPTLETGGRDSGQTAPFHLGSSDPADDGLRT